MFGIIIALAILFLIVYAVRSYAVQRKDREKRTEKEETEKQEFDTVLKMDSIGMGDALICKEGKVYLHTTDRPIGYYQMVSEARTTVYCDEDFEIGFVEESGSDVRIVLSLMGKMEKSARWKELCRQKGNDSMWTAAEAIKHSGNMQAIIDYSSYEPLGHFEGNRIAAAAAFICWAYHSSGNPYSDYYEI